MGQYDRAMKLLVESNPEAMARFVLHEWHKRQGADAPELQITEVTLLSEEFQSEELKGDGVWLLKEPQGPLALTSIEYQSALDATMPLRSLEYLARAKKKHWKTCGDLPVIAVVIYLFDDVKNMPPCPLRWAAPHGQTTLIFSYLIINMKNLSREEFLALREPALWPLVLLTKGPVDRILIEEMFTDLLNQKLYNTLPIGHAIAAWFLRDDDLIWLQKEYQKMFDFFKDSPAFQWMEESAREEAWKKAELHFRAEQKKAEQKAEQKAELHFRAELSAEQKKALAAFRQMVVGLVSQRFPTLLRLARAQVRLLKQPEGFQDVVLALSLARDVDEAQNVLLALREETDEEVMQETSE